MKNRRKHAVFRKSYKTNNREKQTLFLPVSEYRERIRNKRFLILLRFDGRNYDRSGKGDSEGAKRRNSEQKASVTKFGHSRIRAKGEESREKKKEQKQEVSDPFAIRQAKI